MRTTIIWSCRNVGFKKVVAAIVMVLSIIAVIVLVVSLFGSWVVRGRRQTSSIELLPAGENMIATTQERMVRVDEHLRTANGVVTEIDTRARE
ncbi:MAG: hypothetical protein ACK2UP_21725 [Candidatus Promineifilaceae bacterium]